MIWFNDRCLRDFGVTQTDQSQSFKSGAPDFETYTIPGRNGDLHMSNGRIGNVEISYSAFFRSNFKERYYDLSSFLLKDMEYHKLCDDAHRDYFRLASFGSALDPETGAGNFSGTVELTFNCKPELWLSEGDKFREVKNGETIVNPTGLTAKPIVRVYGTVTLTAGESSITVKTAQTFTDIDSELCDCYCDGMSQNQNVTFGTSDMDFPVIEKTMGIRWTGFSKVMIRPRWYKL